MRISDWGSDVCSSDLSRPARSIFNDRAWRLPSAGCVQASTHRSTQPGPGPSLHNWKPPCPRLKAAVRLLFTASPSRSDEHTSELQSLMRISSAVFCLKKKKKSKQINHSDKRTHYTQ